MLTRLDQVMAELQEAVGAGKMIVAKDSYQGGSEHQVNTIFPLDTFCRSVRVSRCVATVV